MASKTANNSSKGILPYEMEEYTLERQLKFDKVRNKVLSRMKKQNFSEEFAKFLLALPNSLEEWCELLVLVKLQRTQSLEVEKSRSDFSEMKKVVLAVLFSEINALNMKIHKLELGFNESLSQEERCIEIDALNLILKQSELSCEKVRESTYAEQLQDFMWKI